MTFLSRPWKVNGLRFAFRRETILRWPLIDTHVYLSRLFVVLSRYRSPTHRVSEASHSIFPGNKGGVRKVQRKFSLQLVRCFISTSVPLRLVDVITTSSGVRFPWAPCDVTRTASNLPIVSAVISGKDSTWSGTGTAPSFTSGRMSCTLTTNMRRVNEH
jgi:hypothetical protein